MFSDLSPPGRFYSLQDSDVIGHYTLLPARCSPASRTAAAAANDPRRAATLAAAAAAAKQAAMTARLSAAQPLLAALLAEPPAAVSVAGASAAAPLVWLGVPGQICYQIPPSANVATKKVTLYVGDGSTGAYYAGALGAAGGPLPAAAKGCVGFAVPAGVPAGRYTLALEAAAGAARAEVLASYALHVDSARAVVSGMSFDGPATLAATVNWSVPAARATAGDIVRAVNARGAVVAWAYTSCRCQTPPARGAAAVASGSVTIKVAKAAAPGGCTFEVVVGGARAGVALNWIPWARLGWA